MVTRLSVLDGKEHKLNDGVVSTTKFKGDVEAAKANINAIPGVVMTGANKINLSELPSETVEQVFQALGAPLTPKGVKAAEASDFQSIQIMSVNGEPVIHGTRKSIAVSNDAVKYS